MATVDAVVLVKRYRHIVYVCWSNGRRGTSSVGQSIHGGETMAFRDIDNNLQESALPLNNILVMVVRSVQYIIYYALIYLIYK